MKKQTTKRVVAGTLGLTTMLFFNSCAKYIEKIDSDINYLDTTSNVDYNTTTNLNDEITTLLENYERTTTKINEETTIFNPTIKYSDEQIPKYENKDLIICSDENFKISDELYKKINNTINNFGKDKISFDIYDLETKNTFSYNLDGAYNGACIVKPSVVMYLCRLAESGLIDLNEKIAYEGNVVSGSGYLNGYYNGYQAYYGQEFTILELMYHTLYYSDNNAYRLLHHYLVNSSYYENYCSYMNSINAPSLKVNKDIIWVRNAKARDGVNVMKDLYEMKDESINTFNVEQVFVDGNSLSKISGKNELTYGQIPYYIMTNGKYDYIENVTGNISITKTGFVSGCGSLSCRNLISISYGQRPYIICLLTKKNEENLRKITVNEMLSLLNDVVNEYDVYSKNNKVLVKNKID